MTILLSQPSCFEDLATPQALLTAMQRLRQSVHVEGQHLFSEWRSLIQRPDFLHSAQNLADYLALRHHDLRLLQTALMPWGLSSLGRMEARVMPNLDAVIATFQVLETLVKTGIPSRAEITDAAMAARAECVMLNKGPHIAEAVKILDDVLTRMQAHQI